MNTIELNDPFTGEWTVFAESLYQYDESTPIINIDEVIYKELNNKYYRRVLSNDTVNVKWFGAKGDGITNDSSAVQASIDTGKNIYFPEGEFLINVTFDHQDLTFNKKIHISGSGTTRTYLKPFNPCEAAIIYRSGALFWTFGTEITNLTFFGDDKSGIGFSFSKSKEIDCEDNYTFTPGDEYSNNVIFRNVDFRGLKKGIQALFGNIGVEFYSTGFHNNKYGAYFIDNKFWTHSTQTEERIGDAMHAGNKYFYGGEISENEVGIYVHNRTNGFGSVNCTNVIFEQNAINTYINTDNIDFSVVFSSCWNEMSGKYKTTTPISIDEWNGKVKTPKMITPHAHIFEGENSEYHFNECRIFDIFINGDNITLNANNCYVETADGVYAGPSIVQGENSSILLSRPITSLGLPTGDNIYVLDSFSYSKNIPVNDRPSDSLARTSIFVPRINKVFDNINKIKSLKLDSIESLEGTFPNINGEIVSDSRMFLNSNKFNIPFNSSNQFMRVKNSIVENIKKGWYVITFDVKILKGNPKLFLWNQNQFQLMFFEPSTKNKWQTFVSYAYVCKDSTYSFYLDISDNKETELLLSAYQVLRFDTSVEIKSFLETKNFVL